MTVRFMPDVLLGQGVGGGGAVGVVEGESVGVGGQIVGGFGHRLVRQKRAFADVFAVQVERVERCRLGQAGGVLAGVHLFDQRLGFRA